MKNERNYLDIHVLQTLPPSCVNRDDTGSTKTAVYGGVTRARVSSQAWKRAVRLMFRELLKPEKVGIRTRGVPAELTKRIQDMDPSANAKKLALDILKKAGVGVNEKDFQTEVMLFFSEVQLDKLAESAVKGKVGKEELQKILKENPSVDQAMFGRMVAGDSSLNYDASVQVAHSISTHEVNLEYDFFTAVDDKPSIGAGHLNTVEYDSATLYRYATVNIEELKAYLKDDTALAARCFVEAFIRSMPTGKQNTFANRTFPDLVYITFRNDQPVNLCGAFEKPIISRDGGFVTPSEKALASYAAKVYRTFAEAPMKAFVIGDAQEFSDLGEECSLKDALVKVEEIVSEIMKEV